ncbi:MAG: hypothetical protein LC808_28470 [Actinobacteria bacterium]|nr:hypothetical protein [Actinomycetota bacterium]
MSASVFAEVATMQLSRDGAMLILFIDGRVACGSLGREAFGSTSAIAASTHFPRSSQLLLQTTRGDNILVDLGIPTDLAPLVGRPTIYLDQNHWSTLTNAIHQPDRVADHDELGASEHLVELATRREVVLPLSSAHMSETCKQVDVDERYRRALTLAQLSAGWQFRDPLDLRRFELRQALTSRYHERQLTPPAAVTLEPNAVHASQRGPLAEVSPELPEEARWAVHSIRCIGGILDAMLDAEHLPMESAPGWAAEFQRFARFLADNPTGPEMKRRRTHAKFIADLGRELAEEAHRVGITPEQMRDWTLQQSEDDLRQMPALGLFREVLHEKLCDPTLRWEQNDLMDMMYLTAAGGYCDHVVCERAHASHMRNGLRRLGRPTNVHRNLRALLANL